MNKLSFIFFAVIFMMSCQSEPKVEEGGLSEALEPVAWLLGTWKIANVPAYEKWTVVGDSMIQGKGFIVQGADTSVSAEIFLGLDEEGWFYIPTIYRNPAGEPVKFDLVSEPGDSLVFYNANQSFPNRVGYHLQAKDSLHAWVSGISRDTFQRRLDFFMKKQD